MSVYTTLHVSRRAALVKVAEQVFGGWTDSQLEQALGNRFGDRLYNFDVGDCGQDDEELDRL